MYTGKSHLPSLFPNQILNISFAEGNKINN